MKTYSFEVVIEREEEDPGYCAYVPSLPGCFGSGLSIEEARESIRNAIRQHIEALEARNEPVPQSDRIVHVEEMTFAYVG